MWNKSSIDNQSFLNALRLYSCLIRFDLSNMERTSRSNSLPVSRTLWKVAFLWSACRAYKILLCESIRACKDSAGSTNDKLFTTQIDYFVANEALTNHLHKLFGHRRIKKKNEKKERREKHVMLRLHSEENKKSVSNRTCIWLSVIKASSSFSSSATVVLNALAIIFKSTDTNGCVYWIRALWRIWS